MANPSDFITGRIESGTQTPGEPAVPVIETKHTPTPTNAITNFQDARLKLTAHLLKITSNTNTVTGEDTIDSMIDELCGVFGEDLSPSLKKAA
ncbi:hypothetical protein HYS95_03790 [Candidatus Daviesbacteria bacterium]|nr:hypothetical protein [Candidatus Daviesbacteria bacterium]